MSQLSVVICTHNPRQDYLERTLASLQAQTLARDRWELLVVDNASDPPVANAHSLSWHANGRHVREDELGLTPARIRGIRESLGPVILFVDDDNVLTPHYLATTVKLMAEHGRLGVIGAARILPEFEVPPAAELGPYLEMLALRDVPRDHWSNDPRDNIVPWGAGLVVRREVAEALVREVSFSAERKALDRSGTALNSGGDDDFSWVACATGWGKGLFRELELTHLIAAKRLEKEYLLRLAEGHSFSAALLLHVHGHPPPKLEVPGTPRDVLTWLLKLRPGRAWLAFRTWRKDAAKGSIHREFARARREGLIRFERSMG
jgi:glycosyltransferase involved in cell wall biosynthesis